MSVRVTVKMDAGKILAARGLGSSKRAQMFLASEVVRLSDPYVPMQQGMLKNHIQRHIGTDGSQIVYTQPYAHYQYYGQVMAGRAPKHYTGDKLTYNGAPMRGARWTERMIADKSKEIERNIEKFIGR